MDRADYHAPPVRRALDRSAAGMKDADRRLPDRTPAPSISTVLGLPSA